MDPAEEWTGEPASEVREQIAKWTRVRGKAPRLYPGALLWAVRKPGRQLRDKVELWLAWKRVDSEAASGALGSEIDSADRAEIRAKVKEAGDAAREEVWGDYRFVVFADSTTPDGLKAIDLGAGHSSSSESLCGRIIAALKSGALLNASVGAGYIERNWPPALKKSGAWPLLSLRQSFLDGSLTRLVDPDAVLRGKIVEWVGQGDFGLGSGRDDAGRPARVWFREIVAAEDVMFEADVCLLTRAVAEGLKAPQPASVTPPDPGEETGGGTTDPDPEVDPDPPTPPADRTIRIHGDIPSEVWNRVGTRLLSKLRSGSVRDLKVGVSFELTTSGPGADVLLTELRQILADLSLADRVRIDG